MSAGTRRKGVGGEREVAAAYAAAGWQVRGLEATGDHLLIHPSGILVHSETKRQEVLRIPLWLRQSIAEAPASALPAVHFRQNRDVWCIAARLADFLAALDRAHHSTPPEA